jgi:PAS domain S-box-containing protein
MAAGQGGGEKDRTGSAPVTPEATRAPDQDALPEAVLRTITAAFVYCRLIPGIPGELSHYLIVQVNDRFKTLFGLKDPVGKRLDQLDPPLCQQGPTLAETFSRVVASGAPERVEAFCPLRGMWLHVRVSSPVEDHLLLEFDDITDYKRWEKNLERVKYSVDHIGDYPLWLDKEGRIVEVSEATCRALGYSRDELLSMNIVDIDPSFAAVNMPTPGDGTDIWERFRTGGKVVIETAHRTKTGKMLPVEVSVDMVSFDGVDYLCSFCRDITERKRLRESLRLTQTVVDEGPDMIHWVDAEGRILYANRSLADALGYSREEMTRLHVWDIAPEVTRTQFFDRWEDGLGRESFRHEGSMRRKDGTVIPVEVSSNSVVLEGSTIGVHIARDITERKRTEEALLLTQLSVDQATDMVQWVDPDGLVVYANQACCDLLGYTSEEMRRLHVWDFDTAVTPDSWRTSWPPAGRGVRTLTETIFRGKDGRQHAVELTADHVAYEGRDYAVAFIRDITERKRMEESLFLTQMAVDQAPDMIQWVDRAGRVVYANRACCDFLGYTLEEMLALHIWDLTPELTEESWRRDWPPPVRIAPAVAEGVLRDKAGIDHVVELSGGNIVYEGNEYGIAFIRDIAGRKQAEQALKDSEQRYRQLFDVEADAIILWDEESRAILEANKAAVALYGYTHEEFLAMNDTELFADAAQAQLDVGEVEFEGHVFWHRKKDGTIFPVEAREARFDWKGRRTHVVAIRDITQRRSIEEALLVTQRTVDGAPEPIHWEDSTGRLIYANEAARRLLGYSQEELQSKYLWDIDPGLTPELFRERWEQWHEAGPVRHESTLRSKDGRLYDMEISSDRVETEAGRIGVSFLRDVTERKQAEQALKESESRYRELFELESDAILLVDDETWEILEVNEAVSTVYGYSRAELLGMKSLDLSLEPDETREACVRPVIDVPLRWHRRKDGTAFPVEARGRHFSWKGRPVHVIAVRDITERRRYEQSLLMTQISVDRASDAIEWVDKTGRLVYANEAATRLLGYSREELLEKHVWDLDVAITQENWPDEWERINALCPVVMEGRVRSKDGQIHPVEIGSNYVEYEGGGYGIAAIRDITERVKAEEALEESRRILRMVLDTAPLHIEWKDRELRFLGCNQAVALDAGLPDTASIVGLRAEDLPGVRVSSASFDDDREVMETGVPKLQCDEEVAGPDGRPRIVRSSKVPLRDGAGQIIGVLGVHEDVTERRQTLNALRERDEQLRQSQKMEAIGRLAGGIAHDFNNVLTTVIGYCDLILSSPEGKQGPVAEDVSEIKAAALRASGLTRQILAFSRRQALQPSVQSLNTVIADTERLLARTLGADIELKACLEPDLGEVEIDENQFIQVLLNLAVNARDAMPRGGQLTVATANVELDEEFSARHPDVKPGRYVRLTVSDTGTGMDADTLAHVFEPFYTTKAPGEGTGLGLATVYGVVAQSGGFTYVTSEVGQGTTFTIYLPRIDGAPAEQQDEASPADRENAAATILVVEDDVTFRTLTVRILEKRGYRVIAVHDGDQALAALRSHKSRIDLLLCDVVLPGRLQGRDVADEAKALRPDLPILFMSAYARDTIVQAGRIDAGADFLEKPFTAEELDSNIRRVLSAGRAGARGGGGARVVCPGAAPPCRR